VSPTSTRETPSPTATTAPVSTTLTALYLHMSPGWLPAGVDQTEGVDATPVYQRLSYRTGGIFAPKAQQVVISLNSVDAQADYGLPGQPNPGFSKLTPGPPIGGSPSVWTGGQFAWYWAPGAVATVSADGKFDTSNEDVAIHVAQMLRTDVNIAMSMPFTVPAQSNVPLAEAMIDWQNGTWSMCYLGFEDPPASSYAASVFRYVEVWNNSSATPMSGMVSGKNAQVGGYRAVVGSNPVKQAAAVLLVGDHGTQVVSEVHGPGTDARAAEDLALSIEFAANLADPTTWPALPIR
jgi:hypothetical protein